MRLTGETCKIGPMHDTSAPHAGATSDTWRLRWDVVKERCARLGATTDPARAQLMGISRATLDRWRKGTHAPHLSRARRAADGLGLPSDAMWERGPQ